VKDHEVREFVNDLAYIAKRYHGHGCLRDVLSRRTCEFLSEFLISAGWLTPYDREGGDMQWPDALERI
jgi:hypothetical protein